MGNIFLGGPSILACVNQQLENVEHAFDETFDSVFSSVPLWEAAGDSDVGVEALRREWNKA